MYRLDGKTLIYGIDERGRCASCVNRLTGHEYIREPGALWKIIYAVRGTERAEVPIWAENQAFEAQYRENQLTLIYNGLRGDGGDRIDAVLRLTFRVDEDGLRLTQYLENRDPRVTLMELQVTPISGARSLDGDPENDYIAWPTDMGMRVRAPALRDISTYMGFRKYERHDQFHSDMDGLYQDGNSCTMQWYDWYNEREGLYCGSEDLTRQALGLHVERDVKSNTLRLGFIRYPMLEAGEEWQGQAMAFFPHRGDWHAGAKIYRAFMNRTGSFAPPHRPAWCQESTGWLRCIFKQHHGETNWTYRDIPALYDELAAAGLDTLFLLGWEKGGFARMWPDYQVDERMGGEEALRSGIEYVHSRGGRVLMFLSYALIDHQSRFYRLEGGRDCTIRSIWGEDIPFGETYCGEGTYRKIGNNPMPMYFACPGAPLWQEKMKQAARVCLELGADAVLYDIGATKPYFCYAENHTHKKPSHSHESKAENYRGLREYVKSFGEDRGIYMEHNMDIYGQYMDMAHSAIARPDARLLSPEGAEDLEAAKEDIRLPEMYRYTFPELQMTNRECAQDEADYKALAGSSFLMGLRFDMTVYRCCGSLRDIPRYAAYLKKLTGLYKAFSDYILRGAFVDQDGLTNSNPYVKAKAWRGIHGGMAATLWNPTAKEQPVTLSGDGHQEIFVVLPPEEATAVLLYAP